jgi:hypothetical protein
MSVFLQPIYTQTASGSSSEITFNSIPQTFTDLMVVVSARAAIAAVSDQVIAKVNGSTSNLSFTILSGDGSSTSSSRGTSGTVWGRTAGSTATSNTYSSFELYIPNYTSSNFKQIISNSVSENNATTAFLNMISILWSNTAAITSLSFPQNSGSNYTNASTFSLYGITKG